MSGALRMRVFAGPNGSGKSTMYRQVRDFPVGRKKLGLGIYVNPDDIAKELERTGRLDFGCFDLAPERFALVRFGVSSGLIRKGFSGHQLHRGHSIMNGLFTLKQKALADQFAQLITQFICHELIKAKKRFSFETVFSHESKLQLMRDARAAGYKVYLYFISTHDPEYNKHRVRIRVARGGHSVPPDRIEQRYYRSMNQLKEAVGLAYHAFLFDNSDTETTMFAEYENKTGQPYWWIDLRRKPAWFDTYYLSRVSAEKAPDEFEALNHAAIAWALRG